MVEMVGGDGSGLAAPVLFGVVRFTAGRVADVVMPFESASAAERYARDAGWRGFVVSGLRFVVDLNGSSCRRVSVGSSTWAGGR